MFRPQKAPPTKIRSGFAFLELIYHATVRNLRKGHTNAVYGMAMKVVQSMLVLAIFAVMFTILGLKSTAIRGDFILYVMSGVMMFMTHTSALGAVSGADGPTSSMMMHTPMNPIISIVSAALASLYQQIFSMAIILFLYHALWAPITIQEPVGMLGMLLLSWFSGAAIGMIFLSAKPWQPDVVGMITVIYQRANMIASGKMLVANATPASIRNLFDWNPLFHTIDQARGFMFLNYAPRYTYIEYPLYVALCCIMVGLMGEFFTRKHASLSWQRRG